MSQALASGDISEMLSTGGGIVGGVAATTYFTSLVTDGIFIFESGCLYLLAMLGVCIIGNGLGSLCGNRVGDFIEGLVDNEQIYWE